MVLTAPLALWVLPVSDLGGVARHVLDVTEVGIPGYRVAVLCPPGPLADRLRAGGADVTTGPVGPEHGGRSALIATRAAVRERRPAVVHSHLSWADVVTAAATVGSGTALVSTEHGIADDDLVYHRTVWRSRAKAALHTARLRRADAVIAVSEATARSVRARWHPGRSTRVRVVRNGVDPLPHREQRAPGLHVCSIARFAPEKRLDALVRAFATLAATHPGARLTLAGTGALEEPVRRLVDELGLADATELPGHVDAADLLGRSDVLVQLSVWENCSYSLLDALVHGVGVVATPVGGNTEILPSAALVPHDEPAAVADAVARQGLEPSTRPALPAGWPTRAQMCADIAQVYREVRT
ncbi:glycosyltransferase family 4 protein [uncultured Phycicoccus sp.]|uniref:glycosyltransferase family 4 protein n=1 Tax=uncultured Phycicoccus sp. TaxID=661422 RepID=UPI00262D4529|nr:glycosyltransferase family 4 protein [uncultured Phycicoccus sp.]